MKSTTDIEVLSWKDVKPQVEKLNPKLASIIDSLSISDKYKLIKVRYPYSAKLLTNGVLDLPYEDHYLPYTAPEFAHLHQYMRYHKNQIPFMLVLKNSFELFVSLRDRIIPYFVMHPGDIFGLWDIFDNETHSSCPNSIWDGTAGARSAFLLPKISEQNGNDRLQRQFDFSADRVNTLSDHWKIFSAIHNSKEFKNKWESEVLLFSHEWFTNLHDSEWKPFNDYLIQLSWEGTAFWRFQYTWPLTFSIIQSHRNIKPNAYHADIVKHLLSISAGTFPGFAAITDDSLGPFSEFSRLYTDVYGMKEWAPVIMGPKAFNMYSENNPVYYSFQYHTANELSPRQNDRASAKTDLYMVSSLLKKYIEEITKGYLNLEKTRLHDIAERVGYDFFHSEVAEYPSLSPIETIPDEDPIFLALGEKFPKTSSFFKGCIRIKNKS